MRAHLTSFAAGSEVAASLSRTAAVERLSPQSGGEVVSLARGGCRMFAEEVYVSATVQVCGDVLLTGREELRRRLQEAREGRQDGPALGEVSDLALVGIAYEQWGPAFTESLHGEFAFVLHDEVRRVLLAARDHFGCCELYCAEGSDGWLLGGELESIRLAAASSEALDETVIGDFLLFGQSADPARTVYQSVSRVPPGHVLTLSGDTGQATTQALARPWENAPRVRGGVRDIVEGFRHVLAQAVSERVDPRGTTIFLSGGMDSSSIAALAREACPGPGLQAVTVADRELAPARETAALLGLDHRLIDPLDLGLFDGGPAVPPEPLHEPARKRMQALAQSAAGFGPCALTGYGGDALFRPSRHAMRNKIKRGRYGQASLAILHALRLGVPGALLRRPRIAPQPEVEAQGPVYPPYFAAAFERRLALRERHGSIVQGFFEGPREGLDHAEAAADLASPIWPHEFWAAGSEVTRVPLKVRHPFFDHRVIAYVFGLNSVPWCRNKLLLREAMRGLLPERVRTRRKTVPSTNPIHGALLRIPKTEWVGRLRSLPHLSPYLDIGRFERFAAEPRRLTSAESDLLTRPLMLHLWLSSRRCGV